MTEPTLLERGFRKGQREVEVDKIVGILDTETIRGGESTKVFLTQRSSEDFGSSHFHIPNKNQLVVLSLDSDSFIYRVREIQEGVYFLQPTGFKIEYGRSKLEQSRSALICE